MLTRTLVVGALSVFVCASARAEPGCSRCAESQRANGAERPPAGDVAAGVKLAEVKVADVPLLDQDGESVRFQDVVQDRIVVMDFVFTTCTTVCPVLSAIFTGVQTKLGDALQNDVRLVSISIDPVRDTPARLKAYGARHRAGPSWTWLTGDAEDVKRALEGLGAYSPDFQRHTPMILVGDARSARWYRFFGFPSEERIVETVKELRALRAASATAEGGR